MKGIGGYGRYDDCPDYVVCPRAKSNMTPCAARDGALATSGGGGVCVGCSQNPGDLLRDLVREVTEPLIGGTS